MENVCALTIGIFIGLFLGGYIIGYAMIESIKDNENTMTECVENGNNVEWCYKSIILG